MQLRLSEVRAACARAGRSFDELEISYETQVLIAPSRKGIREKLKSMLSLTPLGTETPSDTDFVAFIAGQSETYPRALTDAWLVGTPDEIVGQLRRYIELGATHFMLWFMDAPNEDGARLFIEQVAPALQARG
jgi:alkanesulfonate monooxygenase SsuD/methylene tetrahydromethanopterin reductase-like flavin-dependent oxidoreductase (luciferase family)